MKEPIRLREALQMIQQENYQCHYCRSPMYIMYRNTREPKQWTLDRIDNHTSHCRDNVVVSCYECNVRRRQRSYVKFKEEFSVRQFDKLA